MATDRYQKRRDKLLRALRKTDTPRLLVTNETNVSYLTGFTGDSSTLLVDVDRTILVSDTRYETQIADECPELETVIRTNREKMTDKLGELVGKLKWTSLGFEGDAMTFSQYSALNEATESTELLPLSGLVEELRAIKDAQEIKEIRLAVSLAERGFDALRATLRPEATELEVAHDLEHTVRRLGSPGLAFEPIVGVGATAALPHAHPGQQRIDAAGFVLVDWGATAPSGYRSDLTRVLVTGKVPAKLRKIYQVVLEAQLQAIEAIRPGIPCHEVDAAARKVIEDAGYGSRFGHGLGHGIGLDIHESPRMSPVEKSELKPGMVITVEPGIYIPHWGGVRIEDDVLVTKDGYEVLTSVPKQWDEAVVAL